MGRQHDHDPRAAIERLERQDGAQLPGAPPHVVEPAAAAVGGERPAVVVDRDQGAAVAVALPRTPMRRAGPCFKALVMASCTMPSTASAVPGVTPATSGRPAGPDEDDAGWPL